MSNENSDSIMEQIKFLDKMMMTLEDINQEFIERHEEFLTESYLTKMISDVQVLISMILTTYAFDLQGSVPIEVHDFKEYCSYYINALIDKKNKEKNH